MHARSLTGTQSLDQAAPAISPRTDSCELATVVEKEVEAYQSAQQPEQPFRIQKDFINHDNGTIILSTHLRASTLFRQDTIINRFWFNRVVG
jgi:hypothetical protein